MKMKIVTFIVFLVVPFSAFCQSWQQMPMYGGGYVTGLIPHPEEVDTLYARIDVGGIYTTTNAGDTWEPLTQNIIKDNKRNFQVRSFTIDETNTDKMYFISGNSPYSKHAALWLSNDAGENWTRKKSPLTIGGIGFARSSGETLLVHPTNKNLLFIGGQPTFNYGSNEWNTDGGFYKYDISNGVFTELESLLLKDAWINGIKAHPTNTDILYISTLAFNMRGAVTSNKGLWTYKISTDTLTQIKMEEVFDFDFDATNPTTIITTQTAGISISTDAGASWSTTSAPFSYDYNYFVTAHPTDAGHWFFGYWDNFGKSGIIETTDAGSFYQKTKYHTGTNKSKIIYPAYAANNYKPSFGNSPSTLIFTNNATAFVADWYGVWKTTDAATDLVTNPLSANTENSNWTWTWKTKGIYNLVQLRISTHPTDDNVFYNCLADIGYYTSSDAGATATHPTIFPITSTYNIQMAPSNPLTGYAVGKHHSNKGGRIVKTTDGGTNWVEVVGGFIWGASYFEKNNSKAITDIQISDKDENVFILGIAKGRMTNQVYRSNDGGLTYFSWDEGITVKDIFKTWTPLDKLIKDADGETFYIYHREQIYKRALTDAAWILMSNPSTTGWYSQVIAHPSIPATLYATQYGNGIFKSSDNGTTWSSIPSNRMRTTAITALQNRIVVIDANQPAWNKTMDVFYTDNEGITWNNVGVEGLPSMLNGIKLLKHDKLLGWGENTGGAMIDL